MLLNECRNNYSLDIVVISTHMQNTTLTTPLLYTSKIIILLVHTLLTAIILHFVGANIVTQVMKPQIPLFQNLAKLADSGNDGGVEAVRKAFTLYRSCKNATTVENLGVTPLRTLIAERLGMLSLAN